MNLFAPKSPRLSRNINSNYIVLCETTSKVVSRHTSDVLLQGSVPFTQNWKNVPFFLRFRYNGASRVYSISISKSQYQRARRALNTLERRDMDRLLVNLY